MPKLNFSCLNYSDTDVIQSEMAKNCWETSCYDWKVLIKSADSK